MLNLSFCWALRAGPCHLPREFDWGYHYHTAFFPAQLEALQKLIRTSKKKNKIFCKITG
jgi:hypothetical protein